MSWIIEFSEAAAKTDRLIGDPNHVALLAAGLMGEIGGILAEIKKAKRERDAYPDYRKKLLEETGDSLWYFMRLVATLEPKLLNGLNIRIESRQIESSKESLLTFLQLGESVGALLAAINKGFKGDYSSSLTNIWTAFLKMSDDTHLSLQVAASENIQKIQSRWPGEKKYAALFDDDFPEEERFPRRLDIEFREGVGGLKRTVVLRCNGLNFGDRLTDNIEDPDGYRFHDIFHFAYVVHLGWSPVIRALLRCKRKSRPEIDEAQDGARAIILDEAVSATVFSHAKRLNLFEGIDHVDYDLLKSIRGFTDGYEVSRIPLWQWEIAILDGYRVFRLLRNNRGGRIVFDLNKREIKFIAPSW